MNIKTKSFKALSLLSLIALVAYFLGFTLLTKVFAVGVAVTVTPSEVAISTTGDITIKFTPTTAITSGSTITVGWPSSYTGGAALLDTDIAVTGTNITSTVESGMSATGFLSTLTTSGNVTSEVTIVIGSANKLTTPGTAGNYAFSITTSVGDYGAVLQYVGDDNDVTVTAVVSPLLSFAIRNSADTADTNVCALGNLTLSAANECEYRLKVTTNSASGYTVTVTTDGDLRISGSGNVADALDLDLIAENSTVTAGTEGYGIEFDGGATTTGAITESGDFNDDDTPLPMAATTIYTSSGGNNPGSPDTTNTALVTHRAAVDGGTQSGNYTQIVTYTVTASF